MIVGDLFSGIGGFSLAAHWMGWRTAWFSEIDPYASSVLAHHWPDVPNHGDIRAIDWTTVEPVDVLTGGFPCQPHSLAGLRAGSNDERDLFDEIIRAAGVLRPRCIVLENVPGLFTSDDGRFFGRVLGAVAALGYDAEWRVLSAADVGAPHKRERVWIVAHARRDEPSAGRGDAGKVRGLPTPQREPENGPAVFGRGGDQLGHANGRRREQRDAHERQSAVVGAGHVPMGDDDVADATGTRLQGRERSGTAGAPRRPDGHAAERGESMGNPSRARGATGVSGSLSGDAGFAGVDYDAGDVLHWRHAVCVKGADGTVRLIPREAAEGGPESPLWPVAHGVSGRVARLRGIGNSIVPACAYEIFRAIEGRESMTVAA